MLTKRQVAQRHGIAWEATWRSMSSRPKNGKSIDLISPKSIPNSEKHTQLPNTQWVKYVYCPVLFPLEVGRAGRNHSTNTLWKNAFPKAFAILWPICRSSCEGLSSQRTAVRLTLHFIYLTYIIHISYVLLHHLHLLDHLLHHLL